MTNFIPIFPLSIIVYPGEELNLHIFEPRYRQLILDSQLQKKPFGIPVVLNDTVSELGTIVEIVEISKTYDNGKMDIKTRGVKIFRILEIIKQVPDKLYSGAIVNYPVNSDFGNAELMKKVIQGINALHKLLNLGKEFGKKQEELISYDVAHHAALTPAEEYELLSLFTELQRQEYLKRHLTTLLPIVSEMELLKEKVKLNGHFKNLSGFNI